MNNVIICLFASAGFDRATQGVAGAGRRLADALGTQLHAITLGTPDEAALSAISHVADAVTVAAELAEYQPETCLAALTQLCQPLAPRAVLLSNDTYSQELAPRLAFRLGGSAVADGVELIPAGDALQVKRAVYGGKAVVTIALKRSPAVVWLRARAFEPAAPRDTTANVQQAALTFAADARTRIVERKTESAGEARLEDAQIIVSGGRGLGGPEPFEDLKALAATMNAQVAASRAACDAGWCPPTWQVGQTGKKVAPGLYLAVAISGASQHLAGMSDSKVVAAINTDADAPIFKHCRFGIVEDYRKVLPLLQAKLASQQQ